MDGAPLPRLVAQQAKLGAIWTAVDGWTEALIPPRPWIAPGYFLRGSVTTIVGPGGVSKSSLLIAYAASLALGRALNGMRPKGFSDHHDAPPVRSLLYNVEDDQDEQARRLSGFLTSAGATPDDIAGLVLRSGPHKTGTLFNVDPEDSTCVLPTPALTELKAFITLHQVDVLFVDPLAELHGVEENDNTGMRSIIAEFRALAVECNIAVVIVHHTRKGANTPGDAEAGRGASAIVGASRVVLTVSCMTADDAKAFGLLPGQERAYFRVDGGKANYSSLTDCEWFERVIYELSNGDTVAVTAPWEPPRDAITPEAQANVEAAIRRGGPGGPLSPQLGNTPRSVKHAMVEAGITTQPGQKEMLAALYKAGFEQVKFKGSNRKFVLGLRSPDGLPAAAWEDDSVPETDASDCLPS